jgi:hypothetical protein
MAIMAWQILQSPDNKFCIWSTVVDDLIMYDMSEEEVIFEYKKKFGEEGERRAREIILKLKNGEKPYGELTLTFEEAMEQRTWNKSEKELNSDVEYCKWIEKQLKILETMEQEYVSSQKNNSLNGKVIENIKKDKHGQVYLFFKDGTFAVFYANGANGYGDINIEYELLDKKMEFKIDKRNNK